MFSMGRLGRDNEKYSIYGAYFEDEFIVSSSKIMSERISPQTGTNFMLQPAACINTRLFVCGT
jgi:hypothetical protein